jgi:anaerobic magnesium-protoporphyrin IX monomethyl ester cyclase
MYLILLSVDEAGIRLYPFKKSGLPVEFDIYRYRQDPGFTAYGGNVTLDAIIVSDAGTGTFSVTNPLKLMIEGRIADVQVVQNFIENNGRIVPPIKGDGVMSWSSSPKLNGIYLFNYLTKHHFEVALINGYYDEKDRFLKLLEQSPKAVILSTTFITDMQTLSDIVADIRDKAPGINIIAGGSFVYLSYQILKRSTEPGYLTDSVENDFLFQDPASEPDVNTYIVSLRGENILCDILTKIKLNRDTGGEPNTARFDGKEYHFSPRVDDLSDVENYPIDWAGIPEHMFKSGVISMQASTGCPYKCAFCNFIKDHRLSYVKPLKCLISEMKAVSSRGIKYVWFVDDNFRLGKNDLETVCREFIKASLNIRWMTFIRANSLKNVNTALLKQAGCIEVQLGIESADPQVLKNMNKKADIKTYDAVLHDLLAAGIHCSCYFISGFPGETQESAQRTRDFIKNHEFSKFNGNLSWSIFPFVLAPLSPVFDPETRKKFGLKGYMNKWQHNTMNSDQSVEEIMKTFFELDDSGPIYRGDNQNIFLRIGPEKSKIFRTLRHKFSKNAIKGKLAKGDIVNTFRDILN